MGGVSGGFAVVLIAKEQKHCTDGHKSCQELFAFRSVGCIA